MRLCLLKTLLTSVSLYANSYLKWCKYLSKVSYVENWNMFIINYNIARLPDSHSGVVSNHNVCSIVQIKLTKSLPILDCKSLILVEFNCSGMWSETKHRLRLVCILNSLNVRYLITRGPICTLSISAQNVYLRTGMSKEVMAYGIFYEQQSQVRRVLRERRVMHRPRTSNIGINRWVPCAYRSNVVLNIQTCNFVVVYNITFLSFSI